MAGRFNLTNGIPESRNC